jgi:hypothetical protein
MKPFKTKMSIIILHSSVTVLKNPKQQELQSVNTFKKSFADSISAELFITGYSKTAKNATARLLLLHRE